MDSNQTLPIQQNFSAFLAVWDWQRRKNIITKRDGQNKLVNEDAVCRTATAFTRSAKGRVKKTLFLIHILWIMVLPSPLQMLADFIMI